jgi:hypothetical protein
MEAIGRGQKVVNYSGYFHDPQIDSLAESLMRIDKGGAFAVWASSGMTSPSDQAAMNLEMFRRLYDTNVRWTLGETVLRAKAKAHNKPLILPGSC